MPNLPGGGYYQPKAGDWSGLCIALREIYDRLDSLGGNRGQHAHRDDINFNSNRGINLEDPVDPQDAVTLAYFNANVSGSGGGGGGAAGVTPLTYLAM